MKIIVEHQTETCPSCGKDSYVSIYDNGNCIWCGAIVKSKFG